MNITITLTDKQQAAFNKRVTGNATAESLSQTIVTELAQQWADTDYQATSLSLVEKLKSQPQEVLDGIIAQLEAIAP